MQYDIAQQLAKSDLNMQKSVWNFREARVALFIIEFYVVLTHPAITCSMLTIETNCEIFPSEQ